MRSYNNLYEPMLQDDYIKQRFINASKKKKNRNDVREVLENLDEHTELLKKMLTEELFIPDYHKPSIINESSSKKTRRILKPHYKYEQVIHHCAIGQFKPIVMNGLYEFSCGSIPDRGVHYGKKYMRKWLDSYDGKKFFVLKMDVHHFFESINRRILKRKLKAVIRDKRFYRLLCILIEHDKIALVAKILTDAGVEIDAEQTKTLVGCIAFDDISGALEVLREIGIAGAMFEELKIIIEEMRKGVPLGYFTSQWFGNFYLKALDHYIKEELHAEHYMRYMDDMVILGKSKKKLHKMHRAIETYLNDNLDLEIKGDWQVFRFEYPVMKDGKPVLDENRKQVTKGRMLDFMEEIEPFNVIYQTAEDGMGDTIKPRLVEAGADLSRVMVIDDTEEALTLSDDRIEKAIRQNQVRLLIIDPVQAFIGADVDMNRANEVRPVFRKLGMIAEKTGCAIVLIGHLNKSSGTQSTYRGLGSIDIMAAVRSLLFIGKVKKDPTTRVLIHEKSSLAPPGETMAFKLGDEEGFRWVGAYEISADDLLDGKEGKPTETKLQRGTKLIYELLADGNAVTIRELDEKAKAQGISQRTMREARSRMKEELDYRMNEKQENTIRLKKQGRMGDGRILE